MIPNHARSSRRSNSSTFEFDGIGGAGALAAPPLPLALEREGAGKSEKWWWNKMMKKVVDVEETKKQIVLAVPMVLTDVFYFLIPLVSVMFTGHLGQLQLASSALGQSWATVSGLAFMLGLSGALETLCGQGFGARCYKMLGIYLQASCIISLSFSILISMFWWYTEPILKLLHQSPDISKQAAIYVRCLIPGIFAFGILQNILRFLQTQSVVFPLVICSLGPLLLHVGVAYVLVHFTALGYKGAPLATSFSFWISVIMLMLYVGFSKRFKHTWTGISKESFHYVFTCLKLALPSAAMVCLEFWSFEILVLLAGLMQNSRESTSLIAICVNTEIVAYNITYGLSAVASTRVSNELGAMRPNLAKHAMRVSLKLSILLDSVVLLALGLGRNNWASLFTESTDIIKAFSSMTPFLCLSIFMDSIQGILSGVCRGCGWQKLVVFINFGTFYGIGMPVAALLAFMLKLQPKGLWIGLICGLGSQSSVLLLLTFFKKWTALELSTNRAENPNTI